MLMAKRVVRCCYSTSNIERETKKKTKTKRKRKKRKKQMSVQSFVKKKEDHNRAVCETVDHEYGNEIPAYPYNQIKKRRN